MEPRDLEYQRQQMLYTGIASGEFDVQEIIKYYKQYGLLPVDPGTQPKVEVIVVKPKLHLALCGHLI